jgi:hypothetical protein
MRQLWRFAVRQGKPDRADSGRGRPRTQAAIRPEFESLEARVVLSYSGPIIHAIDYSPTWSGWTFKNAPQLSDSDFFNSAFKGLWAQNANRQGRNDLATMASTGFNLVRLYDWGPTRGWEPSQDRGTAHLGFLTQAQSMSMKVMVPVSNYFLGDDRYAWNHRNPDANYSLQSAPESIQIALKNFVNGLVRDGRLHPAVHTISVGNELDLGIDKDPGTTAKAERAIWWVVNLQRVLLRRNLVTESSHPMFTIPVSTADMGGNGPQSWFQVLIHGGKAGTPTPNGSVPGGSFTQTFKGLDSFSWYQSWYYNSVNTFKFGQSLQDMLVQYDTGKPSGNGATWAQRWPGEKFNVPLLVTELGQSRYNIGDDAQFNIIANQQAQVFENVLKTSTNLMGYTIFEFNDEPSKKGIQQAQPYSEALFGINKYYNTKNQNDFRQTTLLYHLPTGETKVSFGTFPSIQYPVYKLYPVESGGTSLLARLHSIFTGKSN